MQQVCALCRTRLLLRALPATRAAFPPTSTPLTASSSISAPSSHAPRPSRGLRTAATLSQKHFYNPGTRPTATRRSSLAQLSPQPLQRRGIACSAEPPANPPEDFEPVEEELAEGETLEMHLTDAAIKQIERAQQAAQDDKLVLRLAVESGGCHGYQYKMQVTSKREDDDYLFHPPTDTHAALLVDSASLPLVKGSTIDYSTELIGSAFKIRNNPQSKDAGCGCGVSWELKDI
ncbi:iron-sulfur cluster assembly accessory protein Isa2 [Rhodotorula toruloides]|uniref:Iron-sulfur cluster assembly accessory protein Isa2 n=1 Tax=Rhodotorula toruloides TaxID=5286 RepID=A0A511KNP8_RHOTO|nr:iron-sulfur cluster assembly accessory protein Isa2 [Rhodotorula toruloides]